jgi:SAM-dependent methyltransferase
MTCCRHCAGIEREFDDATARRDLRRYRRKGPLPGTRLLLQALRAEGVRDATLLDIGGGVGAIHHELLGDGAAAAVHVDASPSYLAAARAEAERRGHADRTTFTHGDFVELAPELDAADVVTLDRVICCYPDMERLVGLSAERAGRLYGLVFPREDWWVRPAFPLANAWFRLRRCPFRIFHHAASEVDAVIRARGLNRVYEASTVLWRVWVYRRATAA